MNADEYISSRVDDQIDWYDRKSQSSQRWFKWLRGIEIVAAASIPLIAGFSPENLPIITIIAVLGALIAVISSVISLNQFQENWIEYRTTCESLRHEKYLYLTNTEPYHVEKPLCIFVQRIEVLISKENSAWSQSTNAALEKSQTVSHKE